jgi:hypothetical protein
MCCLRSTGVAGFGAAAGIPPPNMSIVRLSPRAFALNDSATTPRLDDAAWALAFMERAP